MKVVLLGPPGAGKGTQAKNLCEALEGSHLASGDILRSERNQGTPVGRQVSEILDAGKLVPDSIITEMMISKVLEAKASGDFILDGFPRTIAQAESLDSALQKVDDAIDATIYIDVSESTIVSRCSGRRTCPRCQSTYHIDHSPPAKTGVCDRDGAELVQRSDDRPEIIRQRIAVYRKETAPLLEYYEARQTLRKIDGSGSIEVVASRLLEESKRLCA